MSKNHMPVPAHVTFPLTDEPVDFDMTSALVKLRGSEFEAMIESGGDLVDDELANRILKTSTEDENLRSAYGRYAAEHNHLSSRLREHRGYGLDGDEEPEIQFDVNDLLAWMKVNKPRLWLVNEQSKSRSTAAKP